MQMIRRFLPFLLILLPTLHAEVNKLLPKLPDGKSWKLVWNDEFDGKTIDGTEIDIFEWPWRDGRVQHTLHWDGYGKDHKSKGEVSKPEHVLDGKFHVFSLWWSPEEYVFYVDGKETRRTKAGGVCQVPLYLKWSTEIGDWAGDIRKAKLPDDVVVDYVRVFDVVDRNAANVGPRK